MARLASQEKMGFYPTPMEEMYKIAGFFHNNETDISILDPCFGDGRTLRELKNVFPNAKLYGVELNNNNYNSFAENCDVAINADALEEIVVNSSSFDILFLNPPYDSDYSTNNFVKKRLETRFLEIYTKGLKADGVLIYIVPSNTIIADIEYLLKHYDMIGLYPFADDIYKQWVFIGKKFKNIKQDFNFVKKRFFVINRIKELLSDSELNTAYCDVIAHSISINTSPNDNKVKIFSHRLSESAMEKHLKSDLFDFFINLITPKEIFLQPITEPREGHLALLTASGLMNGIIDDIKIKGGIYKQESVTEDYNEETDTVKQTTVVVPRVRIYSLQEKTLQEIK